MKNSEWRWLLCSLHICPTPKLFVLAIQLNIILATFGCEGGEMETSMLEKSCFLYSSISFLVWF
ncbi:hypothetical protein LguiA_001953 [Lonicera macranthoides]